MLALLRQRLDGVGDCGGARGGRQRGNAALKRGNALFQYVLCRVGQPAVDVARVGEAEPGGGML